MIAVGEHAAVAWEESDVATLIQQIIHLPLQEMVLEIQRQACMAGVHDFFTNAWVSWTLRNKRLFSDEIVNQELMREGFRRIVSDYLNVRRHPDHGVIKMNSDTTVFNDG